MHILVTGTAGFIGFFTTQRLLAEGHTVCGIDNLNEYYDVQLKKDRLQQLTPQANFTFEYLDLTERDRILNLFKQQQFDAVIHLAAQAGVRYSLDNPFAYGDSNLTGFLHILEGCRQIRVTHLVYASSSSIYGMNKKVPFSTQDPVDHPISLYAATKKANELMAHAYSHLYQMPTTGLRFFTVYGPWGRPDMAYYKFLRAIDQDRPIDIYNYGQMQRDFTYIDDVVQGIVQVLNKPPLAQSSTETAAPYKIYNLGNHNPVSLTRFIELLEQSFGKSAQKNYLPMQPGDVPTTYADVDNLIREIGFHPTTPLETGIQHFVDWYRDYHQA